MPFHQNIRRTAYDTPLGLQLAGSTRHLEHLAITWNTDANSFFHEYLPDIWVGTSTASPARQCWGSLRTLSLTCKLFSKAYASWQDQRQATIIAACTAARLMPRLRQLEIWHGGAGSAALFAAHMPVDDEDETGEILWMSTWNAFTPQDEVFKCWRDLMRERDTLGREPDMQALTFSLPDNLLRSRWALLDRLVLQQQMLHPATVRQVQWERDTLKD